jgi:hypothetical protein
MTTVSFSVRHFAFDEMLRLWTVYQSWWDLFVPRTYDLTRTAVKLSLPSNYFLRSIGCPIFLHNGIPFDIFEPNKRGVANAEEYSFISGLIL